MKVRNKKNDSIELSDGDGKKLVDKWEEIKGEILEVEMNRIKKCFYNKIGYECMYLDGGDNFDERVEKWKRDEEWDEDDKWWL